jgi:hypothetical protein
LKWGREEGKRGRSVEKGEGRGKKEREEGSEDEVNV